MATRDKPFTVISFTKDQSVAAVPTIWIDENNFCVWPKKRPANFMELVRSPFTAPPSTWNKWEVEVVKSYDDFDKADDKASRFVATNQVESSEGEVSRKRKKRKVTSKPVFEVPDEAFNQGTASAELQGLPKPSTSEPSLIGNEAFIHRGNLNLLRSEECLGTIINSAVNLHNNVFEPLPVGLAGEIPVFLDDQTTYTVTLPAQQTAAAGDDNLVASRPSDHRIFATPIPARGRQDYNTLLEEFRSFQIVSIRAHEELKSEIRDLKTLLTQVLANVNRQETHDFLTELPLKTEDEFRCFDQILSDKNSYDQLVTYFSKIGGSSVGKCVYNILKQSISHSLQGNLRYTSQSGKVSFGSSRLAEAIRDAVKLTPTVTGSTSSAINLYIGRWFRNWVPPKDGVKKDEGSANSEGGTGEAASHSTTGGAGDSSNHSTTGGAGESSNHSTTGGDSSTSSTGSSPPGAGAAVNRL